MDSSTQCNVNRIRNKFEADGTVWNVHKRKTFRKTEEIAEAY